MGLCRPTVSSYRFHLLRLQSRLLLSTASSAVRCGGGRLGYKNGGALKLLNGVDNERYRTIAGHFGVLGGNGVRLFRYEVGLGTRPSFRNSSNRIWVAGGEHVENRVSSGPVGSDTEEITSSKQSISLPLH